MKAIVYHDYGPADVLKCEEVEKPTPKDDEVLIKIRAAAANPLDWRLMNGKPYSVRLVARFMKMNVKRPGIDMAGEVEEVGRNVTDLKTGDAVFGGCLGAFAEYGCATASKLARKPDNVTFEEAASINVAGLTALQAARDYGQIKAGQKVLINGASGGVGTFAVQIAKSFGAEVTGVCSTPNLEMVRGIGADHVIDYTQEDFTEGAEHYDMILDCIGNIPFGAARRALKREGKFIIVGAPHVSWMIALIAGMLKVLVSSWFVSQKAIMLLAKAKKEDLAFIGEMIAAGKLRPVIDRRYKLAEAADAIRYLEAGHARGKVLITLD